MYRLFVYGTLMSGFGNNRLIKEANGSFVGSAVLDGYEMFSFGGFPGIRLSPGSSVVGEVWNVDDIQRIDILEGHPSFYLRTEVVVELNPRLGLNCQTYVPAGDCPDCESVPSGSWRQHYQYERALVEVP